jgi:hypothetical protein
MVSGLREQDDSVVLNEGDLEGIGAALKAKLSAYRDDAPVPRWDLMKWDQSPNLHAAAGVRSSSEFMKGAKYVSVRWEDGRIILISWKNQRGRDGFAPVKGSDREASDAMSDADLGAVVIAAFAEAE